MNDSSHLTNVLLGTIIGMVIGFGVGYAVFGKSTDTSATQETSKAASADQSTIPIGDSIQQPQLNSGVATQSPAAAPIVSSTSTPGPTIKPVR